MRKTMLLISDLRPAAQRLAQRLGLGPDDEASGLVLRIRPKHQGGVKRLAQFLGVSADVVYQWRTRRGVSGEIWDTARDRADGRKQAMAEAESRQAEADADVASRWRDGEDAATATGRTGHAASDKIARLREKFGNEAVPIRRNWIWTHQRKDKKCKS